MPAFLPLSQTSDNGGAGGAHWAVLGSSGAVVLLGERLKRTGKGRVPWVLLSASPRPKEHPLVFGQIWSALSWSYLRWISVLGRAVLVKDQLSALIPALLPSPSLPPSRATASSCSRSWTRGTLLQHHCPVVLAMSCVSPRNTVAVTGRGASFFSC